MHLVKVDPLNRDRKAPNSQQIAFDPGLMSHSEVHVFLRCQRRCFSNIFSAVDCLSLLLHPSFWLLSSSLLIVMCSVTPSFLLFLLVSVSFLLCFPFFFICSLLC